MNLPPRRAQRGIAMLDALIAVVIFSIGILGMVSLESQAIALASGAKYRTDAAMLADRIIAQMWASIGTGGTLQTAMFKTGGTAYTAWASAVTTALPGATTTPPTITFDSFNDVTVTIFWQAPGDSAPHQYVTTTQIQP